MTGPLLDSPLVSTQWLADHLGADHLVVLDATVLPFTNPNGRPGFVSGHESYLLNGHLPGAVFADVLESLSDTTAPYPFTHLPVDAFAAAAGALGIDNETTVVVYDGAIGQWAARVWWLFRAAGYDRVAVLDGGSTKWIAEERPVETGHVEPAPAVFVASERSDAWVSKSEVLDVVEGRASGALLCAIPPQEFSGEEGARARRGHIPGSVNVPAGRVVDRESRALLPAPALATLFAPVLDEDRVIAYCNGGIAAAVDALALVVAGHRTVALYDGSLNEWSADDAAPLVTA